MSSTPVRLGSNVRATPPRATLRGIRTSSAGLERGQRCTGIIHTARENSTLYSHPMDVMTEFQTPSRPMCGELCSDAEDDIPEVISGIATEVRDDQEGQSSDGGDCAEQHLAPPRLMYGLARSAPPGSLRHLHNSQEMSGDFNRDRHIPYGRRDDCFCDSEDGGDDYEGYVGEEFEAELDEDGNLLCNQEEYELDPVYHPHHLRFYGGMLEREDEVEADDEADECHEISDVDDEDGDYLPDLLSDHDADEIADYISDDGREGLEAEERAVHHRRSPQSSSCTQFISGPHPQPHYHSELAYHVPGAVSSSWDPSRQAVLDAHHHHHQQVITHASTHHGTPHHEYHNQSQSFDGRHEASSHLADRKGKFSPASSGNCRIGSWLKSGFFCANTLLTGKKPSPQVQEVLQDNDWIDKLLGTLPGVDPQDLRIQGVLEMLRGVDDEAPIMGAGAQVQAPIYAKREQW
mmetsp:Transcript_16071/g.19313  ORF Transcript_16071/g.19313 Transcript_16071/m.19313 type:complete len:462 (-) Transcript_16071:184-1569(-)|eukprot:CAMPEP_0197843488 /NCGR_PEP_ID=MMETSP1438-20131217/382_1 /TAXON_ID=1461541 /ORGANISM="Pterosperma sp., Strain CCMP1384" /LENGTH=461 /DNA_ID=CAMNT_0043453671 /DNA_START=458 /DNA_END=1843 /DNA_ORIENTATION=+